MVVVVSGKRDICSEGEGGSKGQQRSSKTMRTVAAAIHRSRDFFPCSIQTAESLVEGREAHTHTHVKKIAFGPFFLSFDPVTHSHSYGGEKPLW